MAEQRFGAAVDWVRRHVDDGRLPAAVLGVATADGTVALEAFGASGSRRARTDDHFALFSVTKPLTAITAAREIAAGRLSALTPLTAAVPELLPQPAPIQLRHLVSHTSGLAEPPLDTALGLHRALRTAGSDFAAGTASRYSTLAFEGVAELIRHASGLRWTDALAAWADPIGATGLTLDPAADPHPVDDAAAAGLDMARFTALEQPGAGLLGRAEDLLAIGTELLRGGGRVLDARTHAMTLRPLTTGLPRLEPYPAERGQDWGFGWNLRNRAPGLIAHDGYGHGGWSGSEFWMHPEVGVAYALLTNRAQRPGVDADQLDNAIVAAV